LTRDTRLFRLTQQQLVKNRTDEVAASLTDEQEVLWEQLPLIADFVFLALHGGVGENGTVQGALEQLRIPYNGSGVAASALCMDKYTTGVVLRASGLVTPQQQCILQNTWHTAPDRAVLLAPAVALLPCIVKPHDNGCSVGVSKVFSYEQLIHAIEQLFATGHTGALIEECIIGMELTVGVLGNHRITVLPPSNSVTTKDILSMEEKFLPGAGENQTPAPLPVEYIHLVQAEIAKAYRALGCKGYARIDCFLRMQNNATGEPIPEVVILECNSLPALTPATCLFHQAAEVGIKPMELIDTIVEYGLELHRPVVPALHTAVSVPHSEQVL
jgi:D-alanine-D-alanine ligase